MSDVQSYQTLIHYYVHEDVLPNFVLIDQGFKADWNTKAAIYGNCPKDLKLQMLDFNSFAGSLHKFGQKSRVYTDPYNVFYSYQKGRQDHKHVYKQSLYNKITIDLPLEDPDNFADSLVIFALSLYFNHQEGKLDGECEMIPVDEEKFIALRKKLEKAFKTPANEMKKKNTTIDKCLELVTKSLERLCPTSELSTISFLYHSIVQDHPIEEKPQFWRQIVHRTLVSLRIIDQFISEEPAYFLPNRRLDRGYTQQLRMFQNGDQIFFLAREVLNELAKHQLNGGEFEEELISRLGEDDLATVEYDDLIEKWKKFVQGKPFDELAYITYEIERTKHRAIFIPSYNDRHCILASDSLLEVLRVLISVKGIFQVVDDENWHILMDSFRIGKKYQQYDAKAPMLIDTLVNSNTNTLLVGEVMRNMSRFLEGIKEVTLVGEEGFDKATLEEQIIFLNLDKSFPNILEFVPVVFSHIKHDKEVLRLCDMYDALEQCQLLAFFEKFPDRFRWLKRHGAHKQTPFDYLEQPPQ